MAFGNFLLWTALVTALGSVAAYITAARGKSTARDIARIIYGFSAATIAVASAFFMGLILKNHFEIAYIYENSSSDLPTLYKVSAFWAGQQGSFLLWALCSAVLGIFMIRKAREYEPWAMVFWGSIQAFLIALLLADSPFKLLPSDVFSQVSQGHGLNELLMNPWMAIHPPVVFLGYAAMTVPPAFAFAALIKSDWKNWVRSALPWAVFGWVTLGAGIILGAYWAYEVLGWGGYWAWDPVENASLVPWLTGTALLHGMLAERYRGSFRKANLALALVTFITVFDATFLTRSDALKGLSVHTFNGSLTSIWILWFMRAAIVSSVVLLVKRWKKVEQSPSFTSVISRDYAFFLAITLFTLAATWVLAGTSWPIIGKMMSRLPFANGLSASSEQWTQFFKGMTAPHREFYDSTISPIWAMILALMALAPVLPWKRDESTSDQRGKGIVIAAVALGIPFIGPAIPASGLVVLAVLVGLASVLAIVINTREIIRTREFSLKRIGGFATHLGIGLLFTGVVLSANGGEQQVRMVKNKPTDAMLTVRGVPHATVPYRFTYRGFNVVGETRAIMNIGMEHGGQTTEMHPNIRITRDSNRLGTPYIVKGFTQDLYVSPATDPRPVHPIIEMNKPVKMDDVSLTFKDFTVPQGAKHTSVSARIVAEVEGGDGIKTTTLMPTLSVSYTTPRAQSGLTIPGTGTNLSVTHVMADEKAVEITITPKDGAPTAVVLKKGQQAKSGDLLLTFKDWIMPQDGQMGMMRIGAEIQVTSKGKTVTLSPMYNPQSAPKLTTESKPVEIPGADMTIALTAADVDGKRIQVELAPTAIRVSVSTKPYISLLWIGSILALCGGCIAMWRRNVDSKEKPQVDEQAPKRVKSKGK